MYWDKEKLERVWEQRQGSQRGKTLGSEVKVFMQRLVRPRQRMLSQLSQGWQALLPEELTEHSCLESFRRGQLRVLVDSSSHLHELNLLVQEGLVDWLRERCPSVGLSDIKLRHQSWYLLDDEGNQVPHYSWYREARVNSNTLRRGEG